MEKALAAINSWGIELDKSKTELLKLYAREVLEKNRNFNLTSARSVSQIWRRHICDGLACLPALKMLLAKNPNPVIADAGSGCGYLGISLKIAWPEARVVLWEKNYKKFQFLNWVIVRLALKDIKAVHARIGDRAITGAGKADAVIERAMGKLPDILQGCLNLAKEPPPYPPPKGVTPPDTGGGIFAAWQSTCMGQLAILNPHWEAAVPCKGMGQSERIARILRSRAFLEKTVKYTLPHEKKERVILIFRNSAGRMRDAPR